jgi:hypothetical protein
MLYQKHCDENVNKVGLAAAVGRWKSGSLLVSSVAKCGFAGRSVVKEFSFSGLGGKRSSSFGVFGLEEVVGFSEDGMLYSFD